MAAALRLFTQEHLEAEIGRELVAQILDDDLDGEADAAAVQMLQESAAGYVIAGLERVYPALVGLVEEWQTDLTAVPLRLRDLALDVAVAKLAKRHPEHVRRDWKRLFEHVDAQIARVRVTGIDSLGIDVAPEPAANQGGATWAGGSDLGEPVVQIFNGPCSGLSEY